MSIDSVLASAKAENDRLVNGLQQLARQLGIDKKHVQTDRVRIRPKYIEYEGGVSFVHYSVSTKVEFLLTDPSKYETLMLGAVELGVDRVGGIRMYSSEFRKHRDQALKEAVKAAWEKARDMAAVLGEEIDRVHSLEEGGGWWRRSGGSSFTSNRMIEIDDPSSVEQELIALGQIPIRARVQAVFELK